MLIQAGLVWSEEYINYLLRQPINVFLSKKLLFWHISTKFSSALQPVTQASHAEIL